MTAFLAAFYSAEKNEPADSATFFDDETELTILGDLEHDHLLGGSLLWALLQAINNIHRYFMNMPLLSDAEIKSLLLKIQFNEQRRNKMLPLMLFQPSMPTGMCPLTKNGAGTPTSMLSGFAENLPSQTRPPLARVACLVEFISIESLLL